MTPLPPPPPPLRALGLAVLAGGFCAALFPPWGLDGFAWVALLPLFGLLRIERSALRATALTWVFGLVWGVAVTWWVFPALSEVYGLRRLVAGPASAAWIATYTVSFALIGPLAVWLRRGWLPPVLAAPLAWLTSEFARSKAFGGMPWLLLGHSQYRSPAVMQLAELGGVPAVSLVLVLVNALLVEAALASRRRGRAAPWLAGAVACFVAVAAGGSLRLRAVDAWPEAPHPVRVGLVNAATPQGERWNPRFRQQVLGRQLELTRRAAARGTDLVVWSETALDFPLDQVPDLSQRLAGALGGAELLAGAPLPVEGVPDTYTNSVALFDARGRLVGDYAKIRLLPVAEYEPGWLAWLPPVRRWLAPVLEGFPYRAGTSSAPLPAAGTQVGVMICFEAIFPDLARAEVDAGARMLVTVSNDSFFPPRSAGEQHFAMTVFRAVETRRPLVRVANRGVSAVVAPSGRIVTRVEAETPAVRVVDVTPRSGRTPFVVAGWMLPWLVLGVTAVGLVPRAAARA